ncbi:MAG: hypothetical protein ACK559_03475, partial [bacterium]
NGAVTVRYQDLMAVPEKLLLESELMLHFQAKMKNGTAIDLPSVHIPKKEIDPYHSLWEMESEPVREETNLDELFYYEIFAKEKSFEEFRSKGIYQYTIDIPENCAELNMKAMYKNIEETTEILSETTAYAALEIYERYISVRAGSLNISVGNYITFHVKCNYELPFFDWIIISKNIILNSGRVTVT